MCWVHAELHRPERKWSAWRKVTSSPGPRAAPIMCSFTVRATTRSLTCVCPRLVPRELLVSAVWAVAVVRAVAALPAVAERAGGRCRW